MTVVVESAVRAEKGLLSRIFRERGVARDPAGGSERGRAADPDQGRERIFVPPSGPLDQEGFVRGDESEMRGGGAGAQRLDFRPAQEPLFKKLWNAWIALSPRLRIPVSNV